MEVFIARQPVLTPKRTLFGYELLFRKDLENTFPNIDGDIATSNLLSNIFFPFEFNEILNNKKGLINFTKQSILQKVPLLLPKEQFIIEVLEDIEPEKDTIAALSMIKEKGYTIALDDFVYHARFDPMIKLSKIIKFDLQATPLDSLKHIIPHIKSKYKVKLLAEKVETYNEFEAAKKMGFNLFQGYFFSRPEMLSTKGISPNQITKLKIINEIGLKELNFKKIETYIKDDAAVSLKLLKYINSAYFNRRVPVDTIKDAIAYLGDDELRKFINIVIVSDLGTMKPNELLRVSIIRARMFEKFSRILNTKFSADELFTLGIFSLMDALLDCKMEVILDQISFSKKMKAALTGNDKEFNRLLDIIKGFEKGNWKNSVFKVISGTAIEKKLPALYFNAVKMANAFYY